MKARRRLLTLFGLLLVSLALMLYLVLPRVLSRAASLWLKSYGFSQVSFEPSIPGLLGAWFDNLRFNFRLDGAELQAVFGQAMVSYDFLTTGNPRLSAIRLYNGQISIAARQAPAGNLPAPITRSLVIDAFRSLPVDRLEIFSSKLAADKFGDLEVINLELTEQNKLTLTAAYGIGDYRLDLTALFEANTGRVSIAGEAAERGSRVGGYELKAGLGEDRLTIEPDATFNLGPLTFPKISLGNLKLKLENPLVLALGGFPAIREPARFPIEVEGLTVASFAIEPGPAALTLKKILYTAAGITLEGALSVKSLELPIPVSNIKSEISREATGRIILGALSAEALGGTIIIAGSIDLGGDRWAVPVKIKNLDLVRLLELYPQRGLAVSGKIDLDFTLKRERGEFSIEDGMIRSIQEGGSIQYDSSHLDAAAQPGLEIAFEALKNFEYSRVKGPVELTPDGKLLLKLAISGRNPDWQKGRPVEFNLNLEDNLIDLFKTIRLTTQIERELDEVLKIEK